MKNLERNLIDMGIKKIIIMILIFIMCLGLPEIVQADEQEQTVVYASTVNELNDAVHKSNIKVILEGKDYAISNHFSITGQNITIQGTEGSRIVSWSNSDEVIYIAGKGITLNNLIIGHDIPVDELEGGPDCTAGVIYCGKGTEVTFIDCDIFGCGINGITDFSNGDSSITAINTTIRDCSSCIMSNMSNGTFQNCTFSGNGYKSPSEYAIYGSNIEFLNCIFSDNKNPMCNKETDVIFTDCQFYRNAWDGYVESTDSEKKFVENISIYPEILSLQYGQSASLSASIYPEDVNNKSVVWRSSNPDRVSVSTEGIVTAINGSGEADIYCFSQDGGKARSNPCKITIKYTYVTDLSVSPFNLSMKPGESRKLRASAKLSEISDEVDEVFMVWNSSNPDIVSVDEKGVVTAIKEGSAKIYVIVPNNYSEKSANCTIKVEKEPEDIPNDPETPDKVLVEGITISPSNISLKIGQKKTLSKSCTPSNADRQSISWHSTDSDIASVDNQGTVTGVSEGSTEIYCVSQDGGNVESNHCIVKVTSNSDIATTEIPKAMKYVPYGYMLQSSNQLSRNTSKYQLKSGNLPTGIKIKSDGELYGVPEETGTFTFTVEMDNNDSSSDSNNTLSSSEQTFSLQVVENTNSNIESMTDPGYELTQRVPNLTQDTLTDQTMVSKGDYEEFVNVFLDGVKLEREVDYTAEPGSTRITIKSQTLKRFNTPGTHTLAMEFRTKRTNTLRWAAQNYVISGNGNNNDNTSNKGSLRGRSSRRGSSSSQTDAVSDIMFDSKKGYVHIVTGIITGEGTGYSCWIQDETGWKLNYADRTLARGSIRQLEDGNTIEQILWELINGSWYAFGADGSVKDGWVYDYQLGSWYCTSAESGMKVSWHTDLQDGHTYYLEPETGKLAGGWKQINNQWYYFNTDTKSQGWKFDETTGNWNYNTNNKEKPFGAMYSNEKTPDGYHVNADGIWDEK